MRERNHIRRLAAISLVALASVGAGLAGTAGAASKPAPKPKATVFQVSGLVMANDGSAAGTFSMRVNSATRSAKTLVRRIVVTHPGTLTKLRRAAGKRTQRIKLRDVAVGKRVTVTWRAPSGTPAVVAVVNAPSDVLLRAR
jgi:hypothetical protein